MFLFLYVFFRSVLKKKKKHKLYAKYQWNSRIAWHIYYKDKKKVV